MPGKVNPVISESAMQVFCQVLGNDVSISTAASGGIGSLLELNLCMPLIATCLLDSISLLGQTAETLDKKLIQELEINKEIAEGLIEHSLMLGTALAPVIGYDKAAKLAKDAFASGETIRQCVLREKLLSEEELDSLLDFYAMTEPNA
jgi:fumarate hydratase class II